MTIDLDKLTDDLQQDSYAAYYGGGYGAAMMETMDLNNAGPQEIVDTAIRRGFDLYQYEI